MKNMLKRIIIGIIIGLVLMCARKYLFINASAATKAQQDFDINSFDSLGLFGMNSSSAYNNAYWKSLDGGYSYLTWNFNNVSPDNANAFFFFHTFNYNYDYAYFTIYQNISTNNSGSCSTLSTQRSTLPIAKLGNVPCEVVYTRNDDNYGQRASYKCPITNSNHLTFFYPQNMGTLCSSQWGIQSFILYYKGNESAIIDSIDSGSQAVSDSVDNLNDTLSSDEEPDTNDFFESISPDESNSPVSDLITMPITLLQRVNNNINGSCSAWNLGSLLGTNLVLPCLHLDTLLGSYLYNLIDMAICLFLAYNIGLMCVTIYNNVTSLKDDFDSMYSPKHTYQPKHGGDDD